MGFKAGVLHGTKKGFVRWNVLCMGEGTAAGHAGTRCVGLRLAVREGGHVSVRSAGAGWVGELGCWRDQGLCR